MEKPSEFIERRSQEILIAATNTPQDFHFISAKFIAIGEYLDLLHEQRKL